MNKKTKRNKTNQEERKSPLQSNFDDLELFMSYLKNKKHIHKWMETVETMEERQALAKNSLHTLAVLENTYARMSGTEAKSVMRKLANKKMLIKNRQSTVVSVNWRFLWRWRGSNP